MKKEYIRVLFQKFEEARYECKNIEHLISDHFVGVNKMISLGSGSLRQVEDVALTRYCIDNGKKQNG